MDNKQLQAKERSFVLKLSKKDIEEILKISEYKLAYLTDSNGKTIPPIIKFYNREKDQYYIQINCQTTNTTFTQLENYLSAKLGFSYSQYSMLTRLIILSDFNFTDVYLNNIDDDQNVINQQKYAKYMYQKFGEEYRTKYNQWARKQNKKIKQQEK